jgi:hypothetical protein
VSHTTLICQDPHLKRVYLRDEGTVTVVLACQRQSGHTGEHAALWLAGPVTWQYGS